MKSLGNDSVLEEDIERHDFERVFMCRLKNYGAGGASLLHLQPSRRADTPAVTWLEPGKSVLRHGSGEIVAEMSGDSEKFFGHDAADRVRAKVFRTGAARAVAVEAGHGFAAAGFQGLSQHILLNRGLSAGHIAL